MITAVSAKTFEKLVLKSKTPALVDCWAPWCGPCLALGKVFAALAPTYEGRVTFVKLDTDEEEALSTKYKIQSIPTLLLFKDGKVLGRLVGSLPKGALAKWIDKSLREE